MSTVDHRSQSVILAGVAQRLLRENGSAADIGG